MSSAAVLNDTPTPTSARNGSGSGGNVGVSVSSVNSNGGIKNAGGSGGGRRVPTKPPAKIGGEIAYGVQFVTPNIKHEPPEDIDDTENGNNGDGGGGGENDVSEFNNNSNSREGASSISGTDSPKIRLTPTSKLLASPNPIDPKRKFVCMYEGCTKSYGKSSHLRSHLTWHTGIKPFVCQEPNCGKGFTRSDELNRHVRTHTGEKPFECIQCTKKFSRSDHLTKHLATHAKQMQNTAQKRAQQHASRQRQINQFEQAFPQTIAFSNNNNADAVKRACDERAKILATHARQMENMINRKRSASSARAITKKKKKSNTGRASDDDDGDEENTTADHMTFSEGMHFMAALVHNPDEEPENISDEDEDDDDSDDDDDGDDEMPVPVRVPEKKAHQPIKLKLERPDSSNQYHVVKAKNNKKSTPTKHNKPPAHDTSESDDDDMPAEMMEPVSTLVCPPSPDASAVNAPIVDKKKLKKNANANSNNTSSSGTTNSTTQSVMHPAAAERPFTCSECDKSFKRQDDLNRHVRTHTGEKPFACNDCDRRFMRSDHLKKHMKTHTKVR